MFEYDMKAHKTMYNGVQFRSRLEATWAAFFDLCEWDWDYEPIDLNGWVPDFIIHGKKDIYVEVKPFTDIEQFNKAIAKIAKTEIKEHILLLGLSPFGEYREYLIGWCNEGCTDNGFDMVYYEPAVFSDHGYDDAFQYQYDYYNSVMSYKQRLNCMHDGDGYNHNGDPMSLWKEAKNITQWYPPVKKREVIACKVCDNTKKVYIVYPPGCIHVAKEICNNCGNYGSYNVPKKVWEEIKDNVKIITEEDSRVLKTRYKTGSTH